jgi:hypothetical protein
VKNLAKLALLFSISFAVIFLAATGARLFSLRVDWARTLPQKPEAVLSSLIVAARWALSLTLYGSLLLALSYAARGHYSALLSLICVVALSLAFSFGILFALDHWEAVPPAKGAGIPLGGNGVILSNSLNRNETSIVLLNGPAEPLGPRVAAIPDRPLLFQEGALSVGFDLPPVPFGDDTPWFLKSLSIDIKLSAEQLRQRFNAGNISFLIYAGALIFLLSSLGFTMKISAWPLANLFIGALAFRGILALETFFNTPEMQLIFESFLKNMFPVALTVPLIFFTFGMLVSVYQILVYAAKKRSYDDD